jgi:hypothetical protein
MRNPKKATALLVSTGVAGAIVGGVLMGTMSANAADDSSTAATSSYAATQSGSQPGTGAPNGNGTGVPGGGDPTKPMRSDEHLLTGDTLAKVTAAVKAKYPDATIQRVESDSDGVYEAHIVDNGKPVTVEVGKSFSITGTESMPAGPHGDGDGPGAPAQQPAA